MKSVLRIEQAKIEGTLIELRNVLSHNSNISSSDIFRDDLYIAFLKRERSLKKLKLKLGFYKLRYHKLIKLNDLTNTYNLFSQTNNYQEIKELENIIINLESLIKNFSIELEQQFLVLESQYRSRFFKLYDFIVEVFTLKEIGSIKEFNKTLLSKVISYYKRQLFSKPRKFIIDFRNKIRCEIKNFFKNLDDEDIFVINKKYVKNKSLLIINYSKNEYERNYIKITRVKK